MAYDVVVLVNLDPHISTTGGELDRILKDYAKRVGNEILSRYDPHIGEFGVSTALQEQAVIFKWEVLTQRMVQEIANRTKEIWEQETTQMYSAPNKPSSNVSPIHPVTPSPIATTPPIAPSTKAVDPQKARASAVMRILIAVARADGVIDDREKSVLRSFVTRLGITREEFQALAREKSIVNIADLPSDRDGKLDLVTEVFSLALADGTIAPEEQFLVQRLSKGLGLTEADVESCLRTARERASSRQPSPVTEDRSTLDRELLQKAIGLLDKDDYHGAARILQSSEKLRQYAQDCRDIAMPWQQGEVVGQLQSLLQDLSVPDHTSLSSLSQTTTRVNEVAETVSKPAGTNPASSAVDQNKVVTQRDPNLPRSSFALMRKKEEPIKQKAMEKFRDALGQPDYRAYFRVIEAECEILMREDPSDPDPYLILGRALADATPVQNRSKAMELFNNALQLDPLNSYAKECASGKRW